MSTLPEIIEIMPAPAPLTPDVLMPPVTIKLVMLVSPPRLTITDPDMVRREPNSRALHGTSTKSRSHDNGTRTSPP